MNVVLHSPGKTPSRDSVQLAAATGLTARTGDAMRRLPDPHEQARFWQALARVPGNAARIVAFIVSRYLLEGQRPRLKNAEIARGTGITARTAQRAIRRALAAGLVKREAGDHARAEGDLWEPIFEQEEADAQEIMDATGLTAREQVRL